MDESKLNIILTNNLSLTDKDNNIVIDNGNIHYLFELKQDLIKEQLNIFKSQYSFIIN